MNDNKEVVASSKKDEDFVLHKLPLNILGSTIISIGEPIEGNFSGGGFGIKYRANDNIIYKCVMGFDETGIWIESYKAMNSDL
jgi:hypothetical protein